MPIKFIMSRVVNALTTGLVMAQPELVYVDDVPPLVVRVSSGPGPLVTRRIRRGANATAAPSLSTNTAQLQFTRAAGNITSTNSNAQLEIVSTFVAAPSVGDARANSRFTISAQMLIGGNVYALTSVDSRFVDPLLNITKYIVQQMDADASAPAVIEPTKQERYGQSKVVIVVSSGLE
jgi:hypothetical protein